MRRTLAVALVLIVCACGDDDKSSSSSSSSGGGADGGAQGSEDCRAPQGGTAAACSGLQTPKAPSGKCQLAGVCQELSNPDVARAEKRCTDSGGTWKVGERCEPTTVGGRCVQFCNTADELVVFYYEDDACHFRNQCIEADGAWLGQ